MPTARRYGARQVGVDPLPGVRKQAAETALSQGAGLEAARAGVGQAIAGVGGALERAGLSAFVEIRREEKERADQVALLNAQNKLDAWEINTLHDPQKGAYNVRGRDSFDLPERIDADYAKVTGEIEKDLATPEQRAAFQRMKLQRGANVAIGVRRHVAGEMRQYEEQELQATLENRVNLAGANALDPRRAATEILQGEQAIVNFAQQRGTSPEARDQQLAKFRTGAHIAVINNLLAQEQDKAAAIYFDETKDQIEGSRRDELMKAIEVGGRKRESQKIADDIIRAGGTLTEQREKARAIEDPDTRDMVTQRLEHEAAVNERAERETDRARMQQATNIVEQTGRFDAIPSSMLSQLDLGQRAGLRNYAEDKARGIPTVTDDPTYYALMRQASKDPTTFVGQNLLNYRHKLGDTEFKQLTALQNAIENGDRTAAEKDLGGFRTKQEILDSTLSQYGIDPKAKPGTAEGKAIAQLTRMLDRRVEAAQASGTKVTNTEIQATLDELLAQGRDVAGSFWNILPGGRPGPWGTERKRIVDLSIDDVPPATRTEIENKLKQRRRPVTDATILDVFIESQIQ